MLPADHPSAPQPLRVSILSQGGYLIASIHTALDDHELLRFRSDLLDQIGQRRCRGAIIDVAALDVIDSFACHTLRTIGQVARLRGAEVVIVGIQPDVALTMVKLGATLGSTTVALDLDEGLDRLASSASGASSSRGADPR